MLLFHRLCGPHPQTFCRMPKGESWHHSAMTLKNTALSDAGFALLGKGSAWHGLSLFCIHD